MNDMSSWRKRVLADLAELSGVRPDWADDFSGFGDWREESLGNWLDVYKPVLLDNEDFTKDFSTNELSSILQLRTELLRAGNDWLQVNGFAKKLRDVLVRSQCYISDI